MIAKLGSWLKAHWHSAWLMTLFGAGLATWVNYQALGVVNNDGIRYLEAARLFGEGQWQAGLKAYNWALYPLLIAALQQIAGTQFLVSAQILTVLAFAATSAGFWVLVRELGGNAKTAGFAVLLWFATPYLAGDILSMVVREHGYWACLIWSLVWFLRFMRAPTILNAALWGTLAVGAVLFRIESLTYLLGLPLLVLFDPGRSALQRLGHFLLANAIVLMSAALIGLLLLANPGLSMKSMGRLHEPLLVGQLVYQQLTAGLALRADTIAQEVLGAYLDDYAMPMLLSGLAYILLVKAFTVGGLLQLGLAVSGWTKVRRALPKTYLRFLIWFLVLSLINGAVILTKGFVLPKRIFSPVAFVIIVLAAFSIRELLIHSPPNRRLIWTARVAALLFVAQLAAVLWPSDTRISYERTAAEWAVDRASHPQRVYFQNDRLRFYGGRPLEYGEDWASIQQSRWKKALKPSASGLQPPAALIDSTLLERYDYFVFNAKRNSGEEKQLTEILGAPVRVFEGPRGNRVVVFHRTAN